MTALYICYQSVDEPLTRTQVLSYLEGLARAGHTITLITFEPKRLSAERSQEVQSDLAERGIAWTSLRYHKRPTLLATMFDILAGATTGIRLTRKHDIRLIHARGQVAGVMGLMIKAVTRAKLLFDMRGLLAEEYADAGVWKRGGFLYRLAKLGEAALLRNADGIVVLTRKATAVIHAREIEADGITAVEVIPCCVDLRAYDFPVVAGPPHLDRLKLVYTGKLGGWYWDEAMIRFVSALQRIAPRTELHVYTQSDPSAFVKLLAAHALSDVVRIRRVAPSALPLALRDADAGLSFIRPSLSKTVSSPTKIGEYLAAGLPVVSTSGIGDIDEMLNGAISGEQLGVIVSGDTDTDYDRAARELIDLLQVSGLRERCRAAARSLLDLETVGWVRYRRMYERLA